MSKMIVNHKVRDFANWKTVFDSMYALRKQFGCTAEHVYRGHENPNEVLIVTHWGNPEQARKYGQSQELKDGMQNAGVVSAPDIYFAE
ncbi:MAG: cyclase [Bacteroidota bacterium]|nr:cyclase [Bacteroidota bacterium]